MASCCYFSSESWPILTVGTTSSRRPEFLLVKLLFRFVLHFWVGHLSSLSLQLLYTFLICYLRLKLWIIWGSSSLFGENMQHKHQYIKTYWTWKSHPDVLGVTFTSSEVIMSAQCCSVSINYKLIFKTFKTYYCWWYKYILLYIQS